MNRLKAKLATLKEFQLQYPAAHVGGSIGLFLRGINLLRDLSNSDLDIMIDKFVFDNEALKDYEQVSDANDFDYAIKKNVDNDWYVKMDIRVCPESSFDVIDFEGVSYNVSKYSDILHWKTKYANKGISKHINDLEAIKTGARPLDTATVVDDGLLF